MGRRDLTGIILASILISLDGTATTVALPSIGNELSTSLATLQWIGNAPLLTKPCSSLQVSRRARALRLCCRARLPYCVRSSETTPNA